MRGLGAWGITVVRITMGVIMTVAGFKKWMAGISVIAAGFEKIPIPLPWISAPFISTLELVGGLLLILGFKTRWLGLLFAIEHTVTTFWVQYRLRGWDSGRLKLMLLAAAIMLFLAGPGKAAIDKES